MAKTALITGCNRGIGLELAKQLKEKSYKIVAVCREASDELKQQADTLIENTDITDEKSLKEALKKIPEGLDIVWQNAGVMIRDSYDDMPRENLDKQIVVNATAPLHFASLLVSKMNDSGKIFFTSSRMGSIEDNSSGGSYGYRMSKAAVNAGAKSLALDLKDKGIAVGIFHPGYVKTRMTNHNGNLEPNESAKGMVEQAVKFNLENTGKFFHTNGEELPW